MSDTIVFEGPDGRLYEIPAADAARYAVPGPKVAELRKRLAAPSGGGGGNGLPPGHFRPGDPLPPGIPPAPVAFPPTGGPSATTTIATPNGGTVTLNFYFGPPTSSSSTSEVEGYHMTFDANGIPSNHVEMLWGDYLDKQGHPAVGWHSHDPVTGNAQ
jgi:hypothetical protein